MQKLSRALTAALATLPFAVFAEQGSFASDGVEIHYNDEGTGPAVVYSTPSGGPRRCRSGSRRRGSPG